LRRPAALRDNAAVKLKRLPEDFQVEEITEVSPQTVGDYVLYRLTKRGIGTPEAVEAIVRRWNIARRQISYGGLKDRHALTSQYLTIRRGPRRDLRQTNIELQCLGLATRPFAPSDITANRFQVVIRSLAPEEAEAAAAALEDVARDGLPNYFDDQRFGSVGSSGQFVARPWIAGDYERALWLALAEPNPLDRAGNREEKRLLREHWGDWNVCKAKLGRSHRRSIVSYLGDRPGDYRGALARVRADLRSLYVAAFQSHLWNQLLAAFLRRSCRPEQLFPVRLKLGPVPFFRALDDPTRRLLQVALPLPSARLRLQPGPVRDLLEQVLGPLGLALRDIRIKYPRDSFFSKGSRSVILPVREIAHEIRADDLYPKRQKLALRFELPRGSYATLLVKRITVAVGHDDEEPGDEPAEEPVD
jgi:tRNA pseudouridine13 synthase